MTRAQDPVTKAKVTMTDLLWCAAMTLLALSPLTVPVAIASVTLVAVTGIVLGAALTALRGTPVDRYLPAIFALSLIIGAVVAALSTPHETLALSWAGGLMLGLLGSGLVAGRRRSAVSGTRVR